MYVHILDVFKYSFELIIFGTADLLAFVKVVIYAKSQNEIFNDFRFSVFDLPQGQCRNKPSTTDRQIANATDDVFFSILAIIHTNMYIYI